MKIKSVLVALAVLVLVLPLASQKASDVYRGLKYDKNAEVKLNGSVEEVQEFDCPVSQALGYHALVKTTGGTLVVHTAPVKFMKQYGLELAVGDKLEIVGAKLKDAAGKETVLAREITRDNATFRFRNTEGKPIW